MAVFTEALLGIIPSDVFGDEPTTNAGYARGTYTLTLASGDVVHTGRALILNEVEKTATLADDTTAIAKASQLGIFYGANPRTNGTAGRSNFEVSFANNGATYDVVAITHGDGSGQVYQGWLHIGASTAPASFFHNKSKAIQKALTAKLTLENRFKVVKSVKPEIAIV